jgi:pimeloyl-ACP methyl ester carboxylesterase
MLVAARHPVPGLVLISPALPQPIRPETPAHVVRLVPPLFRRELIGWAGATEQIRKQQPDLTLKDVARVQHLMGAESGAARRQMLEGPHLDRSALAGIPTLVIGGGMDRLFPEAESERLADWLGAEYQPFGAHSHYGLVIGEDTFEQVADAIRGFLERNRL